MGNAVLILVKALGKLLLTLAASLFFVWVGGFLEVAPFAYFLRVCSFDFAVMKGTSFSASAFAIWLACAFFVLLAFGWMVLLTIGLRRWLKQHQLPGVILSEN
jgi:hypothetical protein